MRQTILNKIVEHKKKEVQNRKKEVPLDIIKNRLASEQFPIRDFKKAIKIKDIKNQRFLGSVRNLRFRTDFQAFEQSSKTLKNNRGMPIIAEIKKASPSGGLIKPGFNHISIAKEYSKAKVDAISVLTDKNFFHGSLDFIREIKEIVNVPILRKDFIVDSYQICESKLYGVDAVLLITSILSFAELKNYLQIAKELNIQCLAECHNKEEIKKAVSAGAEIIGINNRDLATFSIDLSRFSGLRKLIPKNIIVVSESGINSSADAAKMKAEGADAILVGTSIIKSNDIVKKIKELRV